MNDLTRLRYRRARAEFPGLPATYALATARRLDGSTDEPLDWNNDGRATLRRDGFTVELHVTPDEWGEPDDPAETNPLAERVAYNRRTMARHEAWLQAKREFAEDVALAQRVEVWCVSARALLDGAELGSAAIGGVDIDPYAAGGTDYVDDVAREMADEAAADAARTFARTYPKF